MWWFIQRIALRRAARTPLRSLMLLCSVALTVSLSVAIFHASQASIESFEKSSVSLGPQADIFLAKQSGYLTPQEYRPVAKELGEAFTIFPVIELPIVLKRGEQMIHLLISGIDGFAYLSKHTTDGFADTAVKGLFVTQKLADRYSIEPGSLVSIFYDDKIRKVLIAGILTSAEHNLPESAVLGDLLFVHNLLGGQPLSTLGLTSYVSETKAEAVLANVRRRYPSFVFYTTADKRQQARNLINAFRTNLYILLLIIVAVMVGAVFGAAQLSVLSVARELSILELLGLSKRDGAVIALSETILVGSLGAVCGGLMGIPVSRFIARGLLGTAEAFYLPHRATVLGEMGWQVQTVAMLLGILGTCAGAFLPLFRARKDSLSISFHGGFLQAEENLLLTRKRCLLSILSIGISIFFVYSTYFLKQLGIAYSAIGVILVTLAILSPYGMLLFAYVLRRVAIEKGVSGLLAWGYVQTWQRVSALSARLLAVTTALLCGLGILLTSFEQTLEDWVAVKFQADIFIRPLATGTLDQPAYLSPEVVERVENIFPYAYFYKTSNINVEIEGQYLALVGSTYNSDRGKKFYVFLEGGIPAVGESVVLLSESAARKLEKQVEDSILLHGETLRIAGVYRDFTTERGEITVSLEVFQKFTGILGMKSLSISLNNSRTPGEAAQMVREELKDAGVRIATNGELRTLIRSLFRETFSITMVVRVVATALCIAAFLLAIIQQVIERRTEIGNLLKIGVSPAQFSGAVALESMVTAVPAALLGCVGGVVLAYILVAFINPLTFGWSLVFHLRISEIISPFLIVCFSTIIAGAGTVFVGVTLGAEKLVVTED
jgi:putative ABC transport system permease protein